MKSHRFPQKRRLHLLLVEDDDVDAHSVQRSVQQLGVEIKFARVSSGEEALEVLRGTHIKVRIESPCVVLLDLTLPGLGGLEMLKELRTDPKLSNHLVYILTGSKREEDLLAAYSFNVAGYILKDSVGSDLGRAMEVLVDYLNLMELPP